MAKKTQHIIFFTILFVMAAGVVVGVLYFTEQKPTASLSQNQTSTPNPQTIPTSTVIIAASSSAAPIAPLSLPYSLTASTATTTYWPKAWGDISFTKNTLSLFPEPVHHGANSFLNGASSWGNYSVTADVSPLKGGWFDIVARVSNNGKDFVYCEFGPNGTEIIERVNTNDTEIARTSASTTASNATEHFGMQVFGNDVACAINGHEVVGATANNESPTGGIGFVIFGAPADQKQVTVSNVSVRPLTANTIVTPFPKNQAASAPSVPTSPTPPSAPTVTTPQGASTATTTKVLPFSMDTFDKTQGWNTYWGSFLLAAHTLTVSNSTDNTSGGALLDGMNGLNNYTFTATLDWNKGEMFGLYARYADAQNYVLCSFDEPYLGDIHIRLEQHVNGIGYVLQDGDVSGFNQWGGTNITASIEVQDTVGTCSINNHVISNQGNGTTLNPPYSGKIGFMSWDSATNNSEIVVKNINVAKNY